LDEKVLQEFNHQARLRSSPEIKFLPSAPLVTSYISLPFNLNNEPRRSPNSNFVARGLVLAGANRASAPPHKALKNMGILQDIPLGHPEYKLILANDAIVSQDPSSGLPIIRGVPLWIVLQVIRFISCRSHG
jgi:hypothetical protein